MAGFNPLQTPFGQVDMQALLYMMLQNQLLQQQAAMFNPMTLPATAPLSAMPHPSFDPSSYLQAQMRMVEYNLEIADGPNKQVYKDAIVPLRLRLNLTTNVIQRLAATGERKVWPRRLAFGISLESMDGTPVEYVVKGPRAGERMLLHEAYELDLLGQDPNFREINVPDVRVREVSSNHGGIAFALVARLPQFTQVPAARSALFYVKSERMRTPSYRFQAERQRVRRAAAAAAGVGVSPNARTSPTPTSEPGDQQPMEVVPPPPVLVAAAVSAIAVQQQAQPVFAQGPAVVAPVQAAAAATEVVSAPPVRVQAQFISGPVHQRATVAARQPEFISGPAPRTAVASQPEFISGPAPRTAVASQPDFISGPAPRTAVASQPEFISGPAPRTAVATQQEPTPVIAAQEMITIPIHVEGERTSERGLDRGSVQMIAKQLGEVESAFKLNKQRDAEINALAAARASTAPPSRAAVASEQPQPEMGF
eukprot:TRINITY_DN410_c0_g1_i1.p1 TRINITY_DN410_c0_g1~~TRINITY_DN410_c0_g1_i1.p1  ORF type:complete len:541 (+),score=117.73 TRINITY_DN410_c0_g1_i1:182-1624(+)